MVKHGIVSEGIDFKVFFQGRQQIVKGVSTEHEAKRKAAILFAARSGKVVHTWQLTTHRLTT